MATNTTALISVDEYLEREEHSLERHEYLNGEVFMMAGASPAHIDIATNVIAAIHQQLRNRRNDCKVRGSDMRIRASPKGLFSYADAVVSCVGEEFEKNTLLNPIVIVEVLSPSTESYDRGKKFEEYRKIPSFREYLIIAQDRVYVEYHAREAGLSAAWQMREHTALDETITLASIEVTLPVSEIYNRISFL